MSSIIHLIDQDVATAMVVCAYWLGRFHPIRHALTLIIYLFPIWDTHEMDETSLTQLCVLIEHKSVCFISEKV